MVDGNYEAGVQHVKEDIARRSRDELKKLYMALVAEDDLNSFDRGCFVTLRDHFSVNNQREGGAVREPPQNEKLLNEESLSIRERVDEVVALVDLKEGLNYVEKIWEIDKMIEDMSKDERVVLVTWINKNWGTK